ncbi:hypothetical protein F8M41_017875 [Gigaspora margarita]|uniref:Uncharacterized protein n=1 Tax=Gigaspora margarita TaxID=4874 RepID=A0A8H4AMI3_GIGMA|nr:hypothetical protein F8M41_017875 [Gigaspora margarita]
MLKNPAISSKLYFGPGVLLESEHGQIQSFVTKDNSMKAQIQRIIPYSKILHNLHLEEHVLQYQHEWFLVEEQLYLIAEPSLLTQKIIAWLKDQPPSQYFDLFINGILYHFNSVYLLISNMPHQIRKQLHNHFVIGFVPFGGDFKDFIKPFLYEIKKLEQGYYQLTNQKFQLINYQSSDNAKSRLCSQYGLGSLPGPLDLLLYNHHLYMPKDAYHAITSNAA